MGPAFTMAAGCTENKYEWYPIRFIEKMYLVRLKLHFHEAGNG